MIYYQDDHITIYHGDCREIAPTLGRFDLLLTDPPYPDCYVDEYHYEDGIINFLSDIDSKQLVFWSGRADFPLPHSAVHIWNKNPSNHGAQYERIFERNGGKHQKVYTFYMVNSTVAAQMTGDELNEHPSQKPIRLIRELITKHCDGKTILDPFAGSGTTGRAAKDLGLQCTMIEREERYCEIAAKRMAQEVLF